MPTATLVAPTPSSQRPASHFLRNLTSLLITSRLIGESLAALPPEVPLSPEIARKINDLITTGQQGETDIRKPMREAGIVLPSANRNEGASRLVATLYADLPVEGAPKSGATDTVVNLRLLAQHLELRARLTAEEARLEGQERLRRALLNWARQWWNVARA